MESIDTRNLINYFAEQKRYVTLDELCNYFDVSQRTIFYRIKKANTLLTLKDITPIKNVRNLGYILNAQAISAWKQQNINENKDLQHNENKQNRLKEIIWKFFIQNSPITINQLIDDMDVSRNTIIDDLKDIRQNYPELKLNIDSNGHLLKSSEEEKSRFIFNELQKHNSGLIAHKIDKLPFPIIEDSKVKSDIEILEEDISSRFTENAISKLKRIFKFRIWRISMGNMIVDIDITDNDIQESTVNVLSAVTAFTQRYGIGIKSEILFFSELILCSQADVVNYVTESFKDKILDVAHDIVNRYASISGIKIQSPKFVIALINHLYASYFRSKFNFDFNSEALSDVVHKFPEIVKFVQLSCSPLAKLVSKPISINEIALISLYFISYDDLSDNISHVLDRNDNIRDSLQSEVLLVCTSGVSSSAILYSNLHKQYPLITFSKSLSIDELNKILRIPNTAKLIITTFPLNTKNIDLPVVQVKAMMDSEDYVKVENQLRYYFPQLFINREKTLDNLISIIQINAQIKNISDLRKDLDNYLYPTKDTVKRDKNKHNLMDLLNRSSIKIIDNLMNGTDLNPIIKELSEELEKNNIVTSGYCDDILSLIDKYGPYMLLSSDTFLAHAAPSKHTRKIGIEIGILKRPIKISVNNIEEKIKCVIVLVPGFHQEHDKALAQLINIITNRRLYDQILSETDTDKMYKLIKKSVQ
ncbi:MAG: HTH domain-containing protein [Lactobacillus gasseri]|nr:HTH domain-containing protein [Lactobacillus gasseri]